MQETYKPIILKQRAKRLGLEMKPDTAGTNGNPVPKSKAHLLLKLARPMHMLFTEVSCSSVSLEVKLTKSLLPQPTVFFFSLYNSFAFAVLFLFFAAFPYIFALPPYSFSTSQSGLTFISFGIGVFLGGATSVVVDRLIYQKKHRAAVAAGQRYDAEPEHRLYSAMMGSWGIAVGLFWFGWCAGKGAHWAPTLLGAIPFAWGNICLFVRWILLLPLDLDVRKLTTAKHQRLRQLSTLSTSTAHSSAPQPSLQTVSRATRWVPPFRSLQFRVRPSHPRNHLPSL